MAHNVSNIDDRFKQFSVEDGVFTALVQFDSDGTRPKITVQSQNMSGAHAFIEGEDLYAFRELLNELPEEAFKRPADPIETPFWSVGDAVVETWGPNRDQRYLWEVKVDGIRRNGQIVESPVTDTLKDRNGTMNTLKGWIEQGNPRVVVIKRKNADG